MINPYPANIQRRISDVVTTLCVCWIVARNTCLKLSIVSKIFELLKLDCNWRCHLVVLVVLADGLFIARMYAIYRNLFSTSVGIKSLKALVCRLSVSVGLEHGPVREVKTVSFTP